MPNLLFPLNWHRDGVVFQTQTRLTKVLALRSAASVIVASPQGLGLGWELQVWDQQFSFAALVTRESRPNAPTQENRTIILTVRFRGYI